MKVLTFHFGSNPSQASAFMINEMANEIADQMTDQMTTETDENSIEARPAVAPRIVLASRYRSGVLYGDVEICGSTKHGATTMIAVMPPEELNPGESLVTKAWVLGVRNFVVIGHHGKPMKLPGTWYEVKAVQQTTQQPINQLSRPSAKPARRSK